MKENINYWKVGSRWDDKGSAEHSIFEEFQHNNMIFIDRDDARGERFDDEIKIGDIVAIADGLTVVAIARVCGSPFPLKAESIELVSEVGKKYLPYHLSVKDVIAVKVCMTILTPCDQFSYSLGKFFRVAKEDIIQKMERFAPNYPSGWLKPLI